MSHGGKHDIYYNPDRGISQPVPRHREINERLAKKILRELEYVPFYEGKKGVGYKLKESAIELFSRSDTFIKDSVSLMNQNEKEASKVQNGEEAEVALKNLDKVLLKMGEDYWKDIERIMNQFEELQKQYAKNNNLELK